MQPTEHARSPPPTTSGDTRAFLTTIESKGKRLPTLIQNWSAAKCCTPNDLSWRLNLTQLRGRACGIWVTASLPIIIIDHMIIAECALNELLSSDCLILILGRVHKLILVQDTAAGQKLVNKQLLIIQI